MTVYDEANFRKSSDTYQPSRNVRLSTVRESQQDAGVSIQTSRQWVIPTVSIIALYVSDKFCDALYGKLFDVFTSYVYGYLTSLF